MTSPEEKARIERTLERLREEFESLSHGGSVSLRVRSSPHAAQRIKTLSRDLLFLSGHDDLDDDANGMDER